MQRIWQMSMRRSEGLRHFVSGKSQEQGRGLFVLVEESFDFVVSRAVASLPDFFPWVRGKYSQGILYLKGGDINEEIALVMARHKLARGTVHTWPVSAWLPDSWYQGKLVVHIEK